jgi:hypothetical protein
MLKLVVPAKDFFNEITQEFMYVKEQTLQLEHSLVSISKWESEWHKPFLGKDKHTDQEALDYVRCMTITQNVDPLVFQSIDNNLMEQIRTYIDNPMTATTIKEKGKPSREVATSEVIYQWMIGLQIPLDCEKWHLNRLLTLIRVCNIKNSPQQKMSNKEALAQHRSINAARRQKAKG